MLVLLTPAAQLQPEEIAIVRQVCMCVCMWSMCVALSAALPHWKAPLGLHQMAKLFFPNLLLGVGDALHARAQQMGFSQPPLLCCTLSFAPAFQCPNQLPIIFLLLLCRLCMPMRGSMHTTKSCLMWRPKK